MSEHMLFLVLVAGMVIVFIGLIATLAWLASK